MAYRDQTSVDFNDVYFDNIMKSAGVDALTKDAAERAAGVARSTAPVDTGSYRDQIRVVVRESRYRRVYRVVGHDPKTLLIESKTGNLARALKAAKS
ncbi:HK97 gp10 family phage protein [Microbacterium album]|uniref:HK97 gp10 family phage protein n=1 Tax=Microbacterium album TaxID=2053191 RepID=A0A917ICR7_9MICO|nr:HK97 gp10 family phage protein [Microbacterium album]GGH34220.1 hypothetical protein GCM10010921_01750 [Microbacterium album]